MSWTTIPDETRAQNPGLASLVDHLQTNLIDLNGMSTEVAEALRKAKYELENKRDFLESSALYETLEQLRFASNASATPPQLQVRHIVDNVLTQVEISQLMMAAQGGSEDTAAAEAQVQLQLDSLGQFKEPLIAVVEDAIEERANEIVLIHSTASLPSSSTPKPLKDIVRETEKRLEFMEIWSAENIMYKMRNNQTLTSIFDTLHKSVDMLWKMIQLFNFQHQIEKNMAIQQYFDAIIQSTLLRLRILEGHLAEKVYDPATTESLMNARHELVQRHETLQSDLTEKDTLLKKYQSVGKDFGQIVSAYEEVKKQISIVIEDIQHLQQM